VGITETYFALDVRRLKIVVSGGLYMQIRRKGMKADARDSYAPRLPGTPLKRLTRSNMLFYPL
jgi:hypothetical protein